jgi:hypothetical protein
MIYRVPYLQQFVNKFTEANQGKAFTQDWKGLGEMILRIMETDRKRKLNKGSYACFVSERLVYQWENREQIDKKRYKIIN